MEKKHAQKHIDELGKIINYLIGFVGGDTQEKELVRMAYLHLNTLRNGLHRHLIKQGKENAR